MRFSFAESMTDPSYYLSLARACEDTGWDSMIVPDSIAYPEESDSTYPYTPDGNREFLADKPFLEPFTLIPAMAAVTERLRFTTFVVKLPIRHPVLVAKQAMSVAVLSNNRFGFGIGTSPWPEDYAICDERWERRGARTDEMINIIRGLATGDYFSFDGEFYDLQSIKMTPAPSQPIPLLIGGHSDRALRRAAELGDGWMHAGGDPEALAGYLATLHELRKQYERDHLPFEVHVISLEAYSVEGVERLEEMGVTDAIVGFRNSYEPGLDTEPLEKKVEAISWFADEVIAKTR
ncbi:MAG: TIGR03619 family F420-dependent LLM class oxidoreductase [Acidimicrobiales bacterium]